ncbi:hypothetical protein [Capnocytophaga cynodegmi]|uniref:hypothetical protein n=1 Tax=Capnocytophaga cynodegmi TaxID=28189 RepID=UPI0038583EFF
MKRVFSSVKSDIDLRDKIEWQTQFDSQWGDSNAQSVACWKTCQQILTKSGLGAKSGYLADVIVLAREINNNTELEYVTENLEKSKEYLDAELEKGNPILIGVNHTLNYKKGGKLINEGTTDHFIVVIGRGNENNQIFYRFYEVATSNKNLGASDDNKLYVYSNRIEGKPAYSKKRTYIVSQIRKNR